MLKRVSDCLQSRCCTCCGPYSSVLGGCPVILAPTHEIMAGPDRDSQKCLQTLLSILSEAEWPPDENKRDFDLLLVIPDSLPSPLEHLWGKKSQQGGSWPG